MSRYIDTDKIPYFRYLADYTATEGVDYTLKGVIESRVPTEDVAPVVHGYWKPIYSNKACEAIKRAMWYKCSECDSCVTSGEGYSRRIDYEFCPYCGAKMSGDDNEV